MWRGDKNDIGFLRMGYLGDIFLVDYATQGGIDLGYLLPGARA
jgi:hypothetical protein